MSETKLKTKTEKDDTPANNIIFVGKRKRINKETGKPELTETDAPAFINDGETRISLPASDVQKKGFYHEKADVIIALFPNDYKKVVAKNGK